MTRRNRKSVQFAVLTALLASPVIAHADAPGASMFERAISRGPSWAMLAALVGGLLVSLTPCVYPMIAITVSVFGARAARTRTEAALLSGVFVLGIVLMFTVLGVGAALSGSIFGSALSNRWVVLFVSLVFLSLSASMFGAFELALPSSVGNRLVSVGGIGLRGAFALGLVSALVAAPCTGPVLGGILLWIAATHRVVLGTSVMFAFALGLGAPFFVVGTFAVSVPKGGAWMLGVKWFFGVVLAVVALHFLSGAVPALAHIAHPGSPYAIASGCMLAAGLGLASLHLVSERRANPQPALSKAFKTASILPAIVGAFALLSWLQLPRGELQWIRSEAEGVRLARAQGRPTIVDFSAAWCAACGELRTYTFADPAVRSEAARFVAVHVDASDDDNAETNVLKDKYGVVGLPTVVIFDSRGQEKSRFVEFVPPARFLGALRSID